MHDRIRKQPRNDRSLAHIFIVDPLVVPIANLFNDAMLHESLDVVIKQVFLMQLTGTHQAAMCRKYFFHLIAR